MCGFRPKMAIHPGRTLERQLDYYGVSQKWLAAHTGLTEKHISEIINGEASITADTAVKLVNVFGGSVEYWVNLDTNYRADLARIKAISLASEEAEKLDGKSFDILVKAGWIESAKDKTEQVLNIWSFFGINSLNAVNKTQPVDFRVRDNKRINRFLVAAWLRKGEIDAMQIDDTPEYNKAKLVESLPYIRKLTTKKSDVALIKTRDILKNCGVVLLLTKSLQNTFINGATRWLGYNPVIQISDYGKRDDIMWFTLFHELGHVLLHGKKAEFVEADGLEKDNKEKEADDFASNNLIDAKKYANFLVLSNGVFSKQRIISFAKNEDVSPSIVLGRLQKDGEVPYSLNNELHNKFCLE